MPENTPFEDKIENWKKSIETIGSDRLEGVSGLDYEVISRIYSTVENILQDVARNPNLIDATPSLIADAILKG